MNRTPRTGPGEEPAGLVTLRGWLRGTKAAAAVAAKADGQRATFQYLADRASASRNEYAASA
ncbi:hypothetical protein ABZY57_04015 [Streptomyces sp. NPDC006450]|uniref:hypothetical protein n=1 Tax=Streptomyces sp. NPDC006450 TaxID=3155458 RepID=UPI0033A1DB2C